jgi:hypothetical protein
MNGKQTDGRRLPSRDKRSAHRENNPPANNTIISFTSYQYYRRLISEQTLTAQEARGICEKPPYPVARENRRQNASSSTYLTTIAHVVHRKFTGRRSRRPHLMQMRTSASLLDDREKESEKSATQRAKNPATD